MAGENGTVTKTKVVSMSDDRLGTLVELTPKQIVDAALILNGLMEVNLRLPGKLIQLIRKNTKRLNKKLNILRLEDAKLDEDYIEYDEKKRMLAWDNVEGGKIGVVEIRNDVRIFVDAEGTEIKGVRFYPYIADAEKRTAYYEKKKSVNESPISVRILKLEKESLDKYEIPMRSMNGPFNIDDFFTNFIAGENDDEEVIGTRKRNEQ